MAISDSAYVDLTASGVEARSKKLADDTAIVIYADVDAGEFSGYIVDNSGATPSLGTRQSIWGGAQSGSDHDIQVISSTKVLVFSNQSTDLEARIMTISGNTITEQTPIETVTTSDGLDIKSAMISGGTGLVAYRISGGGNHTLCRFTVFENTVTAATPQDHGTDPTGARPISMCKLDGSRVFYMYEATSSDVHFQIIDISSGISEGTPQTLSESARVREVNWLKTADYQCVKVDTNKVLCMWHDDDDSPDSTVGVIVNCGIGTTINSFGTVLNFVETATDVIAGSPDVLATDTLCVLYTNASSQGVIETVAVSGDALTQNGDAITTSTTPDNYAGSLQIVSTNTAEGEGLVVIRDDADSATISITKITGLPAVAVSGTPKFYYDLDGLTERTDLPFPAGINWGAMALTTNDEIFVGNKTPTGAVMALRLKEEDNFTTYEDVTSGLPTTYDVETIRSV